MRKFIRNNIVDVLDTLQDAIKQAQKSKDRETTYQLLCDCHQGLSSLLSIFQDGFSSERFLEYDAFMKQILELLETMNTLSEQGEKTDKVHRIIIKSLKQLQEELKNDSEVKLEIVFMPYKLSMWDSMESIWRTAKNDPLCDCYVVPIPYYEKSKTGQFKELIYEGAAYPDEFDTIHYESYHLEKRTPDVIFFHNPYDENNYVTSVHPDYYSYELKKHTENLVFVPYCIHRSISEKESNVWIYQNVTKMADFAICQNEEEAKAYELMGIDAKKLLPTGNPKLDDVFYMEENPPVLPEDWRSVIDGKKVILLNLSINFVLNSKKHESLNLDMDYFYWVVEQIIDSKDTVLVFRPHPLLDSTFRSMRPQDINQYLEFLDKVEQYENVIIDKEKEIYTSFYYSDGMISTNSSLLCNYILTKKPVFLLELPKWNTEIENSLKIYDFSGCYYPDYEETMSLYLEKENQIIVFEDTPHFAKMEEHTENGEVKKYIRLLKPNKKKREVLLPVEKTHENNGKYYISPKKAKYYTGKLENKIDVPLKSVAEFINLIHTGEDNSEKMLQKFRKKAKNCDGKNGKRAFEAVKKKAFR